MLRVQSLINAYAQAVKDRDIEAFLALYDTDTTVFDAFDHWVYSGNHQWRAVPTDWFTELGSDMIQVTFRDVQAEGVGTMRLVHALVDYQSQAQPDRTMTNRISWIVKQLGDDWKIVHEHTSVPIDSKTRSFDWEKKYESSDFKTI